MKITTSLLFIVSIFLLIGCGDGPKYSEKISITEGKWTYKTPLVYSFDVNSSESLHDLFFSLTYGANFGFQNIYVKIITEYPSSDSTEDVVSLNLTDGSGTFLGDCNSSKCTIDILLQEKFRFKETGKHTISIYQHSRENELNSVFSGELKLFEME